MRSPHVALLLMALPGLTTSLAAQEPRACFRGRPPAVCRSFWITDAALGIQGIGGNTGGYAAGEVGWMRSVGESGALGGGVAVGYANDLFASVRPRYRRWLSHATALDAAIGVRWTPGRVEQAEALIGVSLRDWGGAWGGLVVDLGTQRLGWMVGGRASSYAGLAGYAVAALVGVFHIATYPRD